VRQVVLAAAARRDIEDILWFSEERFGEEAARRYRVLVTLALNELQQEPNQPTAKRVGVGEIHIFPLRIVARRLAASDAVRAPPHVMAYPYDAETVEIVRVLHAAMNLPLRLSGSEAVNV
jgi:toxin ParE1/3/4